MSQQTQRRTKKDQKKAEEAPKAQQSKKRDLSETDALLDEIEEVLETEDYEASQERDRRKSFREKIASINFVVPRRVNCEDLIRLPDDIAEPLLEAGLIQEIRPCYGCD